MTEINLLKKQIEQSLGEKTADLVIRNVSIFHLTTGLTEQADIAVSGRVIVGIGHDYHGLREVDASGLTAVPGFIDAHVHVESSMITPREFEKCVLKHGTTTAVCDPHELANVVGTDAFDFFLESASSMILDLIVRLSSCVPSTALETSGASIGPEALRRYIGRKHASGLSEFMNVPGVLFRDQTVLEKLAEFDFIDGHAPLLSGRRLCAYLAAGVRNCHESSSLAEAREKIMRGMSVFIREGSVAKNLDELIPLITLANSPFLAFCTDDRSPINIADHGHIDGMIARAIARGADPLAVYRTASFSAARGLGLFDRGLIAPGQRADIVLLSDLKTCRVEQVFAAGCLVSDALFNTLPPPPDPSRFFGTVRRSRKAAVSDFTVRSRKASTPVIGVTSGSLLTGHLTLDLPFADGIKYASPENDILKAAVFERYGRNSDPGLGFVKGFGLKRGAIASSVGHDSHNICTVGTCDSDMALAVNALLESHGGFAVAINGNVTGLLPLPVGGILSDRPFHEVEAALRKVLRAAKETGCPFDEPFLQLAFLPLPVIPSLKLTDKGLVDVEKFEFLEI